MYNAIREDLIERRGPYKDALYNAIKKGNVNLVKELIENSVDDINEAGNVGYVPLIQAVLFGNIEIVEELIKAGADVNIIDSRITPLLMAITWRPSTDIVKLLIKAGADVNIGSPLKKTVSFSYMDQEKKIDILKLLIEAGANIDDLFLFDKLSSLLGNETLNKLIQEGEKNRNQKTQETRYKEQIKSPKWIRNKKKLSTIVTIELMDKIGDTLWEYPTTSTTTDTAGTDTGTSAAATGSIPYTKKEESLQQKRINRLLTDRFNKKVKKDALEIMKFCNQNRNKITVYDLYTILEMMFLEPINKHLKKDIEEIKNNDTMLNNDIKKRLCALLKQTISNVLKSRINNTLITSFT